MQRYTISDPAKVVVFKLGGGSVVGYSVDALSFTAAKAVDDALPDEAADLLDSASRMYRVPLLELYGARFQAEMCTRRCV